MELLRAGSDRTIGRSKVAKSRMNRRVFV